MTAPYVLSLLLAALMALQAVLGLAFQEQYRDVAWIRAAWFGNDLVTLLLGAPLLVAGVGLARRGVTRGTLLWLGMLGYAVYNYAFYMLGAALNVFFPLYAVAVVSAGAALILALAALPVTAVAASFGPSTPARLLGGYLVFVAAGLSAVWIAMWAAYVFADRPLPIEMEAFRLVAALDLMLMVPALTAGGMLLWRRRPWGFVIAAIASLQGALYLLVLSLNSAIAVHRGLTEPPGELPIWGPLALATGLVATWLLAHAGTIGLEHAPDRDRRV